METKSETVNLPKVLSVNEMWSLVKGEDKNWGIEGYEVPKQHFDYKQTKWQQERKTMLAEHKKIWPPKDWPVNKETEQAYAPKRPNYLDQVYKWANSFYNKEKAEEIKANLAEKGHPIDEPKKEVTKCKKRDNFLEYEEAKKKKKAEQPEYPDFKQEAIDKVKDKIKEDEERKEKAKKEKGKSEIYGSLPKCDRITIVSDAEHMGEKMPFYKTFVKPGEEEEPEPEEEDDKKKKKKQKKIVFP